jgi:dipeptidyl aminopeptidase/acylaminoacyl peptidase
MPETKRPLKVFLCHAHTDRETVRALYARLRREGVDVWLDKEKLLPGADWEYEIRQAVRESDIVVVCLSKQFSQDGFRQKEVRIALDTAMEKPEGEIFIIPARLEECETLPSLRRWQWVDLYEENGHQKLIRALRARADTIGATLRIRKSGQATTPPPKIKEPEAPTESPIRREHIGDTLIDPEKRSTPGKEKVELGVIEKDIAEEVQHEKAGKETQQKIKREPTEKTNQKRVKRQATKEATTWETLSTFFTGLKSTLSEIRRVPDARRIAAFAVIVIVLVLLATSWALRQIFFHPPTVTPNATTSIETADVVNTNAPQQAPAAIETPTIPTGTPSLSAPMLGGADKIAFIANKDIWLMDVDGSDRKQLTDDGGTKSDLQWLPDRETLVFISGLAVEYINVRTGAADTLTSFPSASSLNAFRVSHDGKQVMISLNNEIFVVPFDFNQMKNVHKKSDLLELHGCIYPDPNFKYSRLVVREALWSQEDQPVAWLFRGVDSTRGSRLDFDQVSVMDISRCMSGETDQLDNFPAGRFKAQDGEPVQYNDDGILSDIDWDGDELFVFNTDRRKGWGELYVYNWKTHEPFHSNQVDGICCYRDARWSPDGRYLFFAFQDQRLGANAPTLLYYVLYRKGEGTKSPPLPIPEGFFKEREEAPQPALRPISTP